MSEPDFKAFEDFVRAEKDAADTPVMRIPRNTGNAPTHFLHLDLSAYAKASTSEQAKAKTSFMKHLDESGATPDVKMQFSDLLEEATQYNTLSDYGGGLVGKKERALFVTDARSISQSTDIEEVLQKDITKDTTHINRFAIEKVRRHEAAHATLDLKEPGSDFIAAATMLRDHPESRKMWENEADIRLVYGLQRGVPALESYGLECHDAIKRALAMTPAELRSASTQALYAIGMEYDIKNDLNRSLGKASPEGKILQTISDYTGKGMFESLLGQQWEKAVTGTSRINENIAEGIRLGKSTPEAMVDAMNQMNTDDPELRRIGNDLKSSIGRLGTYTVEHSPEQAPAPKTGQALQ